MNRVMLQFDQTIGDKSNCHFRSIGLVADFLIKIQYLKIVNLKRG